MALPQEITGALDKIEEKDLINKFYEFVNQNNIPYYVQNFSSPNAVALRSGVYISKLFFHKYTDYALLYALLHESAHYIRYKDIDYDLVDLTDLPFEEFFKKITIEENYADDLAIKTLTTWIKDLNLNLEKLLKNIENLIDQNISKVQYNQLYNLINHFKKNYTNNNEQLIFDLMNNTLQENILRKKISEVIKTLFETPEVAPAEPIVKPKPDEKQGPKPRRLGKPKIHPGADPAPKAENSDILKKKTIEEKIAENLFKIAYKLSIIQEAPLNYKDDDLGEPSSNIKKNIEQRRLHPFSKIDILHKDAGNNQTSIEKIVDDEFKDVADMARKHGVANMKPMQLFKLFSEALVAQKKYTVELEHLAKSTVQKYFGIPSEVMANIEVTLTENPKDVKLDKHDNNLPPQKDNDKEEDNDFDNNEENDEKQVNNPAFDELVQDFTPEEKIIIKQNVDKRTIANALMMGAGFRAHNLLEKIKPELDRMSPVLYPFYVKIMSGGAIQNWKANPRDDGGFEINTNDAGMNIHQQNNNKLILTLDNLKEMGVVGSSRLKMGDDENGDGIREVEGAEAIAMIFPVLLHETVKAVVEYIFAHGLPQYTQKINKEILKQSDGFQFEYWHKLLGPRLWKHLHDAIDFIVKGRGNDYTIVAYLLQEISTLPPDKFLRLIDLILHDGIKAITWLEKMLDRVEADLAAEDEDDVIPQADFGNLQNLMAHIEGRLNVAEEKPQPKHKPFDQMDIQELKQFILNALDEGDYEEAAQARDEIEKREQQ